MSDGTSRPLRVTITAQLPVEMTDDQRGISAAANEQIATTLLGLGLDDVDVQVQT